MKKIRRGDYTPGDSILGPGYFWLLIGVIPDNHQNVTFKWLHLNERGNIVIVGDDNHIDDMINVYDNCTITNETL